MSIKRIKTILFTISLILIMLIIFEGYLLYVNKYNRKLLSNQIEENNKEVTELESDISDLNNTIEENDNKISLLTLESENINNSITSLEEKINEIKDMKESIIDGSKYIENVPVISQFPNYPTGCETISLLILLRYYNVLVSADDIISSLDKGSLPSLVDGKYYGANPENEFVGNPLTKYAYGVYNKPIWKVANMFKSGAYTETGKDFNEVLELVKNDRPVIVWATIAMIEPYISSTWQDNSGNKVNWIANEHALVVIGYTPSSIIVSDPYTGSIRYYNRDLFISRYNYLGKRAVWY